MITNTLLLLILGNVLMILSHLRERDAKGMWDELMSIVYSILAFGAFVGVVIYQLA